MPRNIGTGIYTIPPDTEGIPDQTIESVPYNFYIHDVETDLNNPRPIIAGGTGANDAEEALFNLGGEKSAQLVDNYDSWVWVPGSFRSAAGATNAPVSGHAFAGIVYINEPLTNPPTNANVTVSARDMNDTVVPSRVYVREKKVNVWGPWVVVDATTLPFPPGGGITATTIMAAIQELDAEKASLTYVDAADALKVNKSGDTMSGQLLLPAAPPPVNANAVRKDYVDTTVQQVITAVTNSGAFDVQSYLGMQVNGSFVINQDRPVGNSNTIPGATVITDGWSAYHSPVSRSQIDIAPSGMNTYTHSLYAAAPALSNSDFVSVTTGIEGYRSARIGWGSGTGTSVRTPITICFLSSHSINGLHCIAVRNAALDRSYVATYTHSSGLSQQYNAITIPPDLTGTWNKDSGVGLNITFGISVGSDYYTTANTWVAGNKLGVAGMVNSVANAASFGLTGIMVVHGGLAPPLERIPYLVRPYEQEIFYCQRYFQRFLSTSSGTPLASGIVNSATNAIFPIRFPTPMRIGPTLDPNPAAGNFVVVTAAGGFGATAISSNAAYNTPEGARVDITSSGMTSGQGALLQAVSFPTSIGFSARM